jgi:glycerate 2-kinase
MTIRNRERLASRGDTPVRKVVLEIVEAALNIMNVSRLIRKLLIVEGDTLWIGTRRWDLGSRRRLFVVGAGKAANVMARAVEEALGERITQGLVIVKKLEPGDTLQHIELVEGGHPLPHATGLAASRRILDLVGEATPEDLFISLISGGSSALMSCPLPGISLEDERDATEALLKSSARILEINAVRRHISVINGGRLAQKIEAQGAEMINLIISDSVGKEPTRDPAQATEFFGTPVAPDATTLQDAREVLDRYQLSTRIPRSILEFLRTAGPTQETPKALGPRIHHFVLQRPADACEAARRAAEAMGLSTCVLTTQLEGESREAGTFLACVAKEVALTHRPVSPPCILIAGGETTTRIDGDAGLGGPSQELALGFALEVAGKSGFCICAIDTDGTDGPTEIAGGIADGTTVERAQLHGLNAYDCLRTHDSSKVLSAVGDEVVTGNTGTNLCDLNVVYVSWENGG